MRDLSQAEKSGWRRYADGYLICTFCVDKYNETHKKTWGVLDGYWMPIREGKCTVCNSCAPAPTEHIGIAVINRSLPPYKKIGAIIQAMNTRKEDDEIVALGFDIKLVKRIRGFVDNRYA